MIEGFVIAGGLSSRMGTPKAELVLGRRSLLDRAVEALSTVSNGKVTAIVAKDFKVERGGDSSYRMAHDHEIPGIEQPLRAPIVGLYTALKLSTSPWIAILAVDLPFVTPDLFANLAKHIGDDIDAVVPDQEDGEPQPTCALYRCETVLPVIVDAFATGKLSLRSRLSQLKTYRVGNSEIAHLDGAEYLFMNVNTPDDYSRAEALVGV